MFSILLNLSNPWVITSIVVLGLIILGGIGMMIAIPIVIFRMTMYRNPKKLRTRQCTNTKDEQQMMMFEKGLEWALQYQAQTKDLHLVNEGLNLYGQYIDLGFDQCAVILQGRTESLLYSYYFADVYVKNGYNILVIDVRAHGLSDGKYQTAGIKESDDLLAWLALMQKDYGMKSFVFHGICVGAASAIYAYTKLKAKGSNIVKKIVVEGLFISCYEIFKQHFKWLKKPTFPALQLVFMLAFIFAKVRHFKEKPINHMKDIDIPILFIWSKEDIFARPDKSEKLYAACQSEHKQLAFFPKGRHSHVRSSQETEYDQTVDQFLKKP